MLLKKQLLKNCNFNPRKFRDLLHFTGKDPAPKEAFRKPESFICTKGCPHDNSKCVIVDILITNFTKKGNNA